MTEDYVSLLPSYPPPTTLLTGDKLPCHGAEISKVKTEYILRELKRESWIEGLYARKIDIDRIIRYKNPDGFYKNDFDKAQFLEWVSVIENNTALCKIDKTVGKGIFVPPKRILTKGTFIPTSGIIKLDPTKEDFESKNHCSALQDLNSQERRIYGLIDPLKIGGIFDLINHAPNIDELEYFNFKDRSIKERAATSNLRCIIKYFNGYAIMGAVVFQDICGGNYGKQLLWSYAQPDEYLHHHQTKIENSRLLLFDNRNEHNGEVIDINNYCLRIINIFLDSGELTLKKIASLTRWEIMESHPDSRFIIPTVDSYSLNHQDGTQSSISYGYLQSHLKQYPVADRVIIRIVRDT